MKMIHAVVESGPMLGYNNLHFVFIAGLKLAYRQNWISLLKSQKHNGDNQII